VALGGLRVSPPGALLLEGLDRRRGRELDQLARDVGIVGMRPQAVRALLGKPAAVWRDYPRIEDATGRIVREFHPYTAWEYKQLPGYWIGSHFQVFFREGAVSNVEANDD
jgi:hypothetical protein